MSVRPARKELSAKQRQELLASLESRFEKHPRRHPGLAWADVRSRLEAHPAKLAALAEMERTGGEPDVVGQDRHTGEVVFCDCAAESPGGRRSACYDGEARRARKQNAPKASALELAEAIGIELLDEDAYRALQELGEFDTKTSSWLKTPPTVRERGGALFGDRRYGRVFTYHNGADSYYAARGFRGSLRV
jgi:hypothetical protein